MTRRSLIVIVAAASIAGCGQAYKIAPVSGRITLDGKPLANATVQFYPVAPPGTDPGPTSIGHTNEDGRYSLALIDGGTLGAMVGKHKVFITVNPKPDPNDKRPRHYVQVPMRYNRKSELERDVPPGGAECDFELTSKP